MELPHLWLHWSFQPPLPTITCFQQQMPCPVAHLPPHTHLLQLIQALFQLPPICHFTHTSNSPSWTPLYMHQLCTLQPQLWYLLYTQLPKREHESHARYIWPVAKTWTASWNWVQAAAEGIVGWRCSLSCKKAKGMNPETGFIACFC